MAIIFAEDKANPGGLQKIQIEEDKVEDISKEELETIEEAPTFTSKEMVMGNTKGTVPDDNKIEVQGGNALVNQVDNKKDDGGDEKRKSGFSAFVSSVGDALTGVVSGVENKMEAIYDDPKKRRSFLQGLNTIIKSSGYTPISQAKSPLGKIAEGQKQGFVEDLAIRQKEKGLDIERLKALKSERRYADPRDKNIADIYSKDSEAYDAGKLGRLATERTYTQLLKLKDYTPTGIIENFIKPFEEIAQSLNKGDVINKIRKNLADNPDYVPDQETIIEFKSIIDSGASNRILGKAKELYPVSNVDLQLLLKGAGDLNTNPGALKVLLAAERSLALIEDEAYPIASKLAYPGGDVTGSVGFQNEAAELAAKNISIKLEKDVKDETLKELFGSTEKTPFRIIQAKLYQDLQADKSIPEISAFDKFVGAQAEKENEIDTIKKKYQ